MNTGILLLKSWDLLDISISENVLKNDSSIAEKKRQLLQSEVSLILKFPQINGSFKKF